VWNVKVEAGPVFVDDVEYRPGNTWMVRAGLNF
jgi:hypothetical protein